MNDQIKQILTSPALVRLRDWSGIGPVQRAELEEFAELIVRECALQCIHNEDMDLIEKHFGVE